ncbi:Sel1 domain protein repeat-containing protein [Seminavis robusta]|uniref:Sel1 domain protein repeat-containing protein n=1 Tax=Seminavis robusta TaxID=568900 RepID=A0A9N8EFB4_9STRA|nr:Sel1 domain protein repeat-containing protein [Seminavis robusta]|eukprot:Sro1011_g230970.1 Sel1 domain protein repeat-containing protein (366) ;mRNA; r:2437-3534
MALYELSNCVHTLFPLLLLLAFTASAVLHGRPSLSSFKLEKFLWALSSEGINELKCKVANASLSVKWPIKTLPKWLRELYESLQTAGKKAALPLLKWDRGLCKPLCKPLRVSGNAANNKRQKRDPAADLICPITRELPWVPVVAQDGRTYEKEAIETYFQTQQEKKLPIKSPVTNEPIGAKLLPAPQIKSLIETLIENEAFLSDVAEAWNKKVQETKVKEELLQKANDGDCEAMQAVASNYRSGSDSFEKDDSLAYQWYKKSHEAGNVRGTAGLGLALVQGKGVQHCCSMGMVYLTLAATAGSESAAHCMGTIFARGYYGMPVNEKEAIVWLRKSLGDCAYPNMDNSVKGETQRLLDELLASESN